jgi:1-acyl-sn-glycerol-3-phosphate acyltransferase
MKASKLRTLWIACLSFIFTANTSMQSVIRGLLGTTSRQWVDDALQIWLKRVFKLINVTYEVVNPHQVKTIPGQKTIIMCNHSSLYDIPLSLAAFPNNSLRMLAKKEMSRIPIMGRAMVAAEFPFIDRKNRKQAIKDLAHVKQLLASGIVMWIAPEGTRSKDGKLASFKKGAFITAIEAGAVIIPIGIRGANAILPARTHELYLNQHAQIHIGEPIDTTQFTLADKDRLIESVRGTMKKLVGEAAS